MIPACRIRERARSVSNCHMFSKCNTSFQFLNRCVEENHFVRNGSVDSHCHYIFGTNISCLRSYFWEKCVTSSTWNIHIRWNQERREQKKQTSRNNYERIRIHWYRYNILLHTELPQLSSNTQRFILWMIKWFSIPFWFHNSHIPFSSTFLSSNYVLL